MCKGQGKRGGDVDINVHSFFFKLPVKIPLLQESNVPRIALLDDGCERENFPAHFPFPVKEHRHKISYLVCTLYLEFENRGLTLTESPVTASALRSFKVTLIEINEIVLKINSAN